LHFRTDPNYQIQGKRITVVYVRQDWKSCLRFKFEFLSELLPVGHDRDDLAAFAFHLPLRLYQSVGIQSAVRTPVPAVKRNGDRPLAQQSVEANDPPLLIGQMKGRHRLADLWGILPGAALLQTRHQTIDSIGKGWAQPPHGLGKAIKSLTQRCLHIATMSEGLFEGFRY